MSSFKSAKWRGKAKARADLGITLPLPGGGTFPAIISNPVSLPVGPISQALGVNETVLLETNSESHFAEFDVGYQPVWAVRYVDANNRTNVDQATTGVGRSNFAGTVVVGGTGITNYPAFLTFPNGITVTAGDRWYLEDDPTGNFSYALKRGGAIVWQSAQFTRSDIAQTTKIAFIGRSGVAGTLTNLVYGPINNAMKLVSAALDTALKPVVSIQYTNAVGAPPVSYRIAVLKADGVTPVIAAATPTVVSNTQGVLDLRLDTPIPKSEFGTTPLIVVTQVDANGNTANDLAGQPIRRTQTVTMPAGAQRIGVNMNYLKRGTNSRAILNLAKIAPYQPSNGGPDAAIGTEMDAFGNLLTMPSNGGRWNHQLMWPTDGKSWNGSKWKSRIMLRWKGQQSLYFDTNTFTSIQTGNDGTYSWAKADYSFVNPASGFYGVVQFDSLGTGANLPTDLYCAEIDGSGNYIYDPAMYWYPPIIEDIKQFHDNVRVMDPLNTVGNSSFAVTATSRTPAFGSVRGADGAGIDALASLSTKLQKPLDWTIPLYASDDYIRYITNTLITHRSQMLSSGSHTLGYTNEPWNSGQQAWREFSNIGLARGYPGTLNDQALKAFAVENERVMAIVTDEATQMGKISNGKIVGLKRLLNCAINSNTAGLRAQLNAESVTSLALTDVISCAPYAGSRVAEANSAKGWSATTDPTEIAARLSTLFPDVWASAKVIRDYAVAKSKEFDMYEGGFEKFHSDFFTFTADIAFATSPVSKTSLLEYLDVGASVLGGPATLHLFDLEGGAGAYGLRLFTDHSRTQVGADGRPPAYKYDAALTKIEALNAAA